MFRRARECTAEGYLRARVPYELFNHLAIDSTQQLKFLFRTPRELTNEDVNPFRFTLPDPGESALVAVRSLSYNALLRVDVDFLRAKATVDRGDDASEAGIVGRWLTCWLKPPYL
jgi:hypothetical protein